MRDGIDDADVEAAADSVLEAANNIRDGVENGAEVDLSPLGDATESLRRPAPPYCRTSSPPAA